MKLFDRYVLKEIAPPAVLGLVLCTFVLLMNQILLLGELFIRKGVPLSVAAEVLLLLIPSILAFGVPMSVLIGLLGGLGRLSADSEMTAFQTLGIGIPRLLRPAFVFAVIAWMVSSYLALVLAPRANDRWVRTMTDSVLARAELRIRPQEFNESIPNMVLFIQDIPQDKTWRNVFVFLKENPGGPRIILARRGSLHLYPDSKRATLELHEGTIHSGSVSSPEEYSITSFGRLEEEIDVESLFPTISSEKRVREKDIFELRRDLRRLRKEFEAEIKAGRGSATDERGRRSDSAFRLREIRSHEIEIHKKFALPFTCLIFVLIGVPLGVVSRKGGRTSGFSLSLAIIVLYYVLITTGEKMAVTGTITAFWGMWGPDFILALAGLFIWFWMRRRPGGLSRPLDLSNGPKGTGKPSGPRQRKPRRKSPFRMSLRFPNILDRYVIRKYLVLFGFVFVGLLAFSVLATFFERLDDVFRHGKSVGLLLTYLRFRLPEIVFFILPVTTLTSSLLTLGLMAKSNEVTAMKASGISLYRIVAPVLALALAAGGTGFLLQDRLMPAANSRAEEIWNRIVDLPPRSYSFLNRHWILGLGKNRLYHYEFFDPESSTFGRLSLFDIDLRDWTMNRRLFAEAGAFGENLITVERGWVRDFRGMSPQSYAVLSGSTVKVPETRSYFLREGREPGRMSFGELRSYTREVRDMGFETTKLRIDLGTRLAFPLVSLVMALLAIPFAFSLGKRGALAGAGLSVAIAAAYWGAVAIFRSLGFVGFLEPFAAVWGPHLIFGVGGAYFLFRLRT